ncbi:hypothetical protein BCR43DRAFT_438980 [Syncephalastrum racemosum]|uniref:Rhomboid-type serine protease n=1 Tax=Syncephalastrum racemosum TaxID=13706 RepID=A0A1X2HGX3_SYNRA|nr:hypothetical protein BCR43DRAFT_438980 [Syncephalastrum racemosum]
MPFQHRRRRRRATDQDKGWPIVFTYVMVVAVLCIMSGELILNREVSGEFFEADPFNYMLGPSVQTLIQTGARYVPCMRNTTTMPSDERYVCLRRPVFSTNGKDEAATGAASDGACTLEDVCGMGGFVSYDAQLLRPDQSFRFFTPLFVHSGLVSLAANLVLHVHIGLALEAVMNGVRLAFVYFVTGVFGNLFGATFATVTAPSTGCSPAILGMVGCLLVDLVYTWRTFLHPWLQLLRITLLTALCFGLGLLPGVDSFTNLGGYISGLLIGVWAVPAVHYNRRFTVGVWVVRITCLAGIVTLFSLLTLNFYRPDDFDEFCPYCRYISCLPVSGSCDQEDYY